LAYDEEWSAKNPQELNVRERKRRGVYYQSPEGQESRFRFFGKLKVQSFERRPRYEEQVKFDATSSRSLGNGGDFGFGNGLVAF
jgi:hypothetical protein